ncbi:hypothetical protein KCP76_19000 [Salmonella enterica subsp. enterica serovar Weltevreden]|nr:hypothetical protein KCP76_19000 [Salmonella enterica subsp. enterica serovar Weltevreden]
MPVLRLRDARFMRRIRNGTVPNVPDAPRSRPHSWIFWRVSRATRPQNLTDGQTCQRPRWCNCLNTIS